MIFSARRPVAPATEQSVAAPEDSSGQSESERASPAEAIVEQMPKAPRVARIVSASVQDHDARLLERERLLARFLASEGRGAITRAADQFLRAGFEFPVEQPVQLQLLEHNDEALVRDAIGALRGILTSEPPLKRPIFEQRLKRLEDGAEEEATRSAASDLRRALRS
jgi:hypothetical protein